MESITLNLCLPYNLYSPSFFPSHPSQLQLAGAELLQASWPLNILFSCPGMPSLPFLWQHHALEPRLWADTFVWILTPLLASRDVGQVILKYLLLFYIVKGLHRCYLRILSWVSVLVYPGGSRAITRGLIRGKQEGQREETAVWRWEQRLQRGSCEPKVAGSREKLGEVRNRFSSGASRKNQPCQTYRFLTFRTPFWLLISRTVREHIGVELSH